MWMTLAIALLFYGLYYTGRTIFFLVKGHEALAEIIDQAGSSRISFTTARNQVIIGSYWGFEEEDPPSPRTEFVLYDPGNPRFYIMKSPLSLYVLPGILLVSGVIVLVLSL